MVEDDKTQLIADAATTLFSRYGFKRTSVEDIAREAGVAKGTVYLYFRSKGEIFHAVCEQVAAFEIEAARAAAARDGSLEDRVAGVLEAKYGRLLELVERSPHAAELLDTTSAYGADVARATEATMHALVAELLAGAEAGGEVALGMVGLDPAGAAALIMRAAAGASARGPDGSFPSVAEHAERLRRLVRVMLRGMAP